MADFLSPPSPVVQPRVLIFIVAYNAKTTLGWVLDRIPAAMRRPGVEVLVIDDSSPDNTFQTGVEYVSSRRDDSGTMSAISGLPTAAVVIRSKTYTSDCPTRSVFWISWVRAGEAGSRAAARAHSRSSIFMALPSPSG